MWSGFQNDVCQQEERMQTSTTCRCHHLTAGGNLGEEPMCGMEMHKLQGNQARFVMVQLPKRTTKLSCVCFYFRDVQTRSIPYLNKIPAFMLEVYGRDGALKPSPLGGATVGALPLCSMGVGLLVIYVLWSN